MIFEDKFERPVTVIQKARLLLKEFQIAQVSARPGFHNPTRIKGNNHVRWQPPTPQQVKLNWDLTLNSSMNTSDLSTIIRDYKGETLVSASCNKQSLYNPISAEALAL